jgi:hypothetical protein
MMFYIINLREEFSSRQHLTARNLHNTKKKKKRKSEMNIHNQVIENFIFSFRVSEC